MNNYTVTITSQYFGLCATVEAEYSIDAINTVIDDNLEDIEAITGNFSITCKPKE